jgi:DNA-binding HxlR family transcriptional regulator
MSTRRSYADACPLARALDVVGERWALLVVRELRFGPRRFSDLRRALPGASTNMLTDRLRELAEHGVVSQRRLPAPAASVVYELTEDGRALMPALEALGAWGARLPRPSAGPTLSAVSVLWFIRGCLRARPTPPADIYRVELDDGVWTVRTVSGRTEVESGETAPADAGLRTDPVTLGALIDDPAALDAAIAAGTIEISGRLRSARRLLRDAHASSRYTITPPPDR